MLNVKIVSFFQRLNPFSHTTKLQQTTLKTFWKLPLNESTRIENMVTKGEIAHFEHAEASESNERKDSKHVYWTSIESHLRQEKGFNYLSFIHT